MATLTGAASGTLHVRDEEIPCTAGQEQVWLASQLAPDALADNETWILRRVGPLDVRALQQAFDLIVARHEAWRTTFAIVDGRLRQVVHDRIVVPLRVVDLTRIAEPEREAEVSRIATEHARLPFDLERGPLVRPLLLRMGAEDHRLHLTVHQMVSDDWSVARIVLPELASSHDRLRCGLAATLPPAPRYGDHALAERRWLTTGVLEPATARWRRALSGCPGSLQLPTDRRRPPVQTRRGGIVPLSVPSPTVDALRRLAAREGTSLVVALLSALAVLLQRHCGQDDLLLGLMVDGRRRRELEGMVGFLVDPIPIRADLTGDPTFPELLARVHRAHADAAAVEVPFAHLMRSLTPERDASRHPLFQVTLSHQPPRPPDPTGWQLRRGVGVPTSRFDLALQMEEETNGLCGGLTYNADLFDAETAERLVGRWRALLEGIATQPGRRVAELPILTASDRRVLRGACADPSAHPSPASCIHELVEQWERRTPEAIAIVHGERRMTYAELGERSERLAGRLRVLGVGPETLVGVCLTRAPEAVLAVLAVMKAGGAYVPIDPAYPAERIALMLEDARIGVLVTESRLIGRLPPRAVNTVCIDDEVNGIAPLERVPARPENLAYVIYTSGSTGRPKGVMIEHRGVVNHIAALVRDHGLGPGDTVLQLPSLSFHPSVRDILGTLCAGARLVLLDEDAARDPMEIVGAMARRRVTCVLSMVPSLLRALLDDPRTAAVREARLRLMLTCGEPLRVEDARRAAERFGCAVANQFGPTETIMACSKHTVTEADAAGELVPAGRPEAGARLYVLDRAGRRAPIGVPGELHVGGTSLARGYLHRDELTAERFLPDPYAGAPGARMYRTGDLVRHLADGTLEFLGRIDDQVKVRGHRVELGEIEAVLAGCEGVADAAAVALPDPAGGVRLVGVVVPRGEGGAFDTATVRSRLEELLPAYMIPAEIAMRERLPRTPNGKLDRRALESAGWVRHSAHRVESPVTELEGRLERMWSRALGRPSVGRNDGFFELGGHSLMAAQMMAAIETEFGRRVPLASFFRSGLTIARLAALLTTTDAVDTESDGSGRLLVRIRSGVSPVLFCIHSDEAALLAVRHYLRAVDAGRAVFGLLPPRIGRHFDRTSSIEEMSLPLVDEVLRAQPQGPYLLTGHSLGGLLAYEVARALRDRGHEVPFLGLADTPTAEAWVRARREWMALASRLRRLRDRGPRLAGRTALAVVTRHGRALARARLSTAGDGETQWFDVDGSNVLAVRYRPAGLGEPLVIFASESSVREYHTPTLGWDEVHRGPVRTHVIPGDHLSLLQEPNVGILAEAIADRIRDVGV